MGQFKAGKSSFIKSLPGKHILLAGITFPDGRKPVVIFDNIGKPTQPQLVFLRDLNMEKRYLFIAIQ